MNWDSLGDFLAMGGYAVYVWPSFIASALVLGWVARRALTAEATLLDELRRRDAARASAGEGAR